MPLQFQATSLMVSVIVVFFLFIPSAHRMSLSLCVKAMIFGLWYVVEMSRASVVISRGVLAGLPPSPPVSDSVGVTACPSRREVASVSSPTSGLSLRSPLRRLCTSLEMLLSASVGIATVSLITSTSSDDECTEGIFVHEGEATRSVFLNLVGRFLFSMSGAPLLALVKIVFSELPNRVGFCSRSPVETKRCSLEETLSALLGRSFRVSRTVTTGFDDACTEGNVVAEGEVTRPAFLKLVCSVLLSRSVAPL